MPVAAELGSVATGTCPPAAEGTAATRRGGGVGQHLLALAVVLATLIALTPTFSPWTSDDGAYAHAVYLLEHEGRWHDVRHDIDLGDDPTRYPLANAAVDEAGRAFPYTRHPGWILVLRATTSVFGHRVGFLLPGAVGLICACWAAWRLAERIGGAAPWAAFWMVGTSPLLVATFALWAHTVSAALGGLAALVLIRLLRGPSPVVAAGLGAVLAAGLLVRTEGALLAAAVLLVLGAERARSGPRWRRWVDPAIAGFVVGAAFLVEKVSIAAMVSGSLSPTGPEAQGADLPWIAGRALGAWRVLGSGLYGDWAGETVVAGATVAFVAGIIVLARRRGAPAGLLLLAMGVVLVAVRWRLDPVEFVFGILPAWPAVLAGLLAWVANRRVATRPEVALIRVIALFVPAVLVTQYVASGGVEWGGRYLSPVVVPAAVVAVAGLARHGGPVASAPAGGDRRIGALGAALVVGVVVGVLGLGVTMGARKAIAPYVSEVRAVDDVDLVITVGEYLPRFDIDPASATRWQRAGEQGPAAAVRVALAHGALRVAVAGAGAADLDIPGTTVEEVTPSLAVYEQREG